MPNNVNRVYKFRPAMAIFPELKAQKLAIANGATIVECLDRGCKINLEDPNCFADDQSVKEFDICGTCQSCQNDFYKSTGQTTAEYFEEDDWKES